MGRMVRIVFSAAVVVVLLTWLARLPAEVAPRAEVQVATAPSPPRVQTHAQHAAQAALPAFPFGDGPPVLTDDSEVELRERNRGIDPARLTATRPLLAESLLHQVELHPHPRGGFSVGEVAPESLAARLDLRRGDVLLTIDHPENVAFEESAAGVLQQTRVGLQVTRDGQTLQLRAALDSDGDDATRGR